MGTRNSEETTTDNKEIPAIGLLDEACRAPGAGESGITFLRILIAIVIQR